VYCRRHCPQYIKTIKAPPVLQQKNISTEAQADGRAPDPKQQKPAHRPADSIKSAGRLPVFQRFTHRRRQTADKTGKNSAKFTGTGTRMGGDCVTL
tara:strand:+ start:133 stop:420 length:288 start_codon:yes stop_codon:yes gene_type:complete